MPKIKTASSTTAAHSCLKLTFDYFFSQIFSEQLKLFNKKITGLWDRHNSETVSRYVHIWQLRIFCRCVYAILGTHSIIQGSSKRPQKLWHAINFVPCNVRARASIQVLLPNLKFLFVAFSQTTFDTPQSGRRFIVSKSIAFQNKWLHFYGSTVWAVNAIRSLSRTDHYCRVSIKKASTLQNFAEVLVQLTLLTDKLVQTILSGSARVHNDSLLLIRLTVWKNQLDVTLDWALLRRGTKLKTKGRNGIFSMQPRNSKIGQEYKTIVVRSSLLQLLATRRLLFRAASLNNYYCASYATIVTIVYNIN